MSESDAGIPDRNPAPLRIVAFAGSVRRGSYNRALIDAARSLAPVGMEIEQIEIVDLPFYNAELEGAGDPPSVAAFKAALRAADGVLIATPEYNSAAPAIVTNAIDWGSRLPGTGPLIGKPVALMGASPSQIGTARAQLYVRQLLDYVLARALPPPELLVTQAHQRFDAEMRLTDEMMRLVLTALLERFARWIVREQAAAEADRSLAVPAATSR